LDSIAPSYRYTDLNSGPLVSAQDFGMCWGDYSTSRSRNVTLWYEDV